MKGAAELLGVSYGTLYGRYRETFGYLKHSWTSSSGAPPLGPVPSLAPVVKATYSRSGINYSKPKTEPLSMDSEQEAIFEQLRAGRITIKQAGTLLGLDHSTLAYQLTGKVCNSPYLRFFLKRTIYFIS